MKHTSTPRFTLRAETVRNLTGDQFAGGGTTITQRQPTTITQTVAGTSATTTTTEVTSGTSTSI